MPAPEKSPKSNFPGVLQTGTGAGILVALAVIGVFILAATFLKSLVFGVILACFFLPLEKFFEKQFLQGRGIRFFWSFLDNLAFPFRYLKARLAGKTTMPTPEEIAEKQRQRVIFRACIASALAFLLAIALTLFLLGSLLIPAALAAGKKLKENQTVKHTLAQMETAVLPSDASGTPEKQKKTEDGTVQPGRTKGLIPFLREAVPEYIKKNHKDIANLVFKGSRGLVSGMVSILSSLGGLALDLLLCAFFFVFFLQHLASFRSGCRDENGQESIGNWCVRGIFSTRWMPEVAEDTRVEAGRIIDWIAGMFIKWIRGYLWIIIIETLLYLTAFSLCSVPYAPFLAVVAGLTILLPFLGPIGSFLLTAICCLVFCREHTLGTLIGVSLTYILINGVLEQLFLYPKLIGNALELSTLETIIAVLLGGLVAGIPGMIFAVPAAAILKYLIPKIYQAMRKKTEK